MKSAPKRNHVKGIQWFTVENLHLCVLMFVYYLSDRQIAKTDKYYNK